ncbi:hypothetical protein QQ045_013527 [Rhodiola kirilowii]
MSSFLQLEELKLYLNPASASRFTLATMTEMLKACPVLKRLEIVTVSALFCLRRIYAGSVLIELLIHCAHVPPCTPDDTENGPVEHLRKCLRFIKISGFCGVWVVWSCQNF